MCILAAAKIRLIFSSEERTQGVFGPQCRESSPGKFILCPGYLLTDVPVRKCDESWAQNDNLRTEKAGYKEQ